MTNLCQSLVLASAIYYAEGGTDTRYPYGIKSLATTKPRHVCLVTITNNFHRWRQADTTKDYVSFLSSRYCPGADNLAWQRNVKFFMSLPSLPVGQEQRYSYVGRGKFKQHKQ